MCQFNVVPGVYPIWLSVHPLLRVGEDEKDKKWVKIVLLLNFPNWVWQYYLRLSFISIGRKYSRHPILILGPLPLNPLK
jgi:hypothetical protein